MATIGLFAALAVARPVQAAGVVTQCSESALVSAVSSGGTVTFECGPGQHTIDVTSEILISNSVVVNGGGTITLDGNNNSRIFHIQDSGTLELHNITLTGGFAKHASGGAILNDGGSLTINHSLISGNGADGGGGLKSTGPLHIIDSTFTQNTGYHEGGAILISGGVVTIEKSLFQENRSSWGGAISNDQNGGNISIINSTFSGNTVGFVGGYFAGGAVSNESLTTITASTFAGNATTAGEGNNGADAILNMGWGHLFLYNSIVVDPANASLCDGSFDGTDGVLAGDGSCGANIVTTDPVIEPLADNGGPTLTHALLRDAAAVNRGVNERCPATDQRGVTRPVGPHCDLGAYELASSPPVIENIEAASSQNQGFTTPITVTASDPDNDTLSYWFDCDGDGSYEIGPQPEHVHDCLMTGLGDVSVGVQVSDFTGLTDDGTVIIRVLDAAPIITNVSVTPDTIEENNEVSLAATFWDPGTTDTFTCTITWGDGSADTVLNLPAGSTSCEATHTYTDDDPSGTSEDDYHPLVTVTDNSGNYSESSATVTVQNVAPVISDVSLNDTLSIIEVTVSATDQSPDDTLSYWFDCDNDGTYEIGPQVSNTAACDFTGVGGVLTIGVQVTDDDGGVATDSAQANRPAPEIVSIVLDPNPIDENNATTLTATFTNPEPTDTFECTIDWGDGTDDTVLNLPAGSTECVASHTYTDDDPSGTSQDDYTVTVTITDIASLTDVETQTITVKNVAPTIETVTLDDTYTVVHVSVTASDPGPDDTLSYWFDCDNDGTFEIGPQATPSTDCALADASGLITIGVQITDDDLGVATSSASITRNVIVLCTNPYTGRLRLPYSPECSTSEVTLKLPQNGPLTLCVSQYTGATRWSRADTCAAGERRYVATGDGSLGVCVHNVSAVLRVPLTPGQCQATERQRFI